MPRSTRAAPTTGKGGHTPAPHFGRKSYSQEASCAGGRKNVQAPPPSQESGDGKVLSGLGPGLPGGPAGRPARPLPTAAAAAGPGRCCPSPSPAPTLPPARPRALSPRALRRAPSSSRPHSPSRAAPPLPRDPASGHSSLTRARTHTHTHTASGPALPLPHSHTARPRLQGGPHIMRHSRATCPARAHAPRFGARGSRAGGGTSTPARASGGLWTCPRASWEMEFSAPGGRGPPTCSAHEHLAPAR